MNTLLPPIVSQTWSISPLYSYLQLITVFTLLSLLIQRELTINSKWQFPRTLRRVLLIGIIPLLFVFFTILSWHIAAAS